VRLKVLEFVTNPISGGFQQQVWTVPSVRRAQKLHNCYLKKACHKRRRLVPRSHHLILSLYRLQAAFPCLRVDCCLDLVMKLALFCQRDVHIASGQAWFLH